MTAFERWALWLTSGATAGSGLLYAWMKYFLDPLDAWSVINHPWQPAILKLHILVAPLLIFTIGVIAARHVWHQVRSDAARGRWTGLAVGLVVAPMIVTGSAIQVITDARAVQVLAITHLACGIAYGCGLALHRLGAAVVVGIAAAARESGGGR